ncbi:MAG: PRTRC system protein E, partial [Clostridiales Family XIII bacterium]|nr:PRTRC system protein E [Clostridiales Family XIII bacterium]
MRKELQDAVAVFKALGWADAAPEDVLRLPPGTPEQKRTALAGLKSGEWGEFAKLSENTYGWRSFIDADSGRLALFAIRVGVDARRAANILTTGGFSRPELQVAVIAERGARYASDFINHACISRRRMFEHSASAFGNTAVRLVYSLDLDVPQTVEYIKDWSVYAAAALGLKAETRYNETDLPGLDLIEKRYAEHIRTGAAVGAPATGPFSAVLSAGVKRGLIARDEAVSVVFSALDAAIRPGDRKVWLRVLDELSVSDAELAERAQTLIPLLSTGETAVIERLAPTLIARAEGGSLTELLLASLTAKTKKAREAVLKSALGRPRPCDADALASWLSVLAGDA